MNLGGARFAGETWNEATLAILDHRKTNQTDQGTARHGTQAPPSQEPRDTGQKTAKPTKVIQSRTGKP